MAILQVRPGSLKVTENNYLEISRVHQFYVLLRNKLPVEPLTLIRDPGNGVYYVVNGHHRAYAAILVGNDKVDADLLRTDYDVRECNRGRAKNFNRFKELLEDCRKGNKSSNEIGLDEMHDYVLLQPMHGEWSSKPIIHIVSLNPTIDVCGYAGTHVAGGKGFNIARNLMQIGYHNICTYAFAGGLNGNLLARLINHQKIPFYLTSILDETITVKITGPFSRERVHPQNPEVRFNELQDLEEKITAALNKNDFLVLAGSLPRNVRPSIFQEWMKRFNRVVTTVFDSSEVEPFKLAIEGKPKIIKPNREEVLRYFGKEEMSIDDIAEETNKLRQLKGIEVFLVSLDRDGALLITPTGTFYSTPIATEVKCSTGAGDALVAGYLYGQANEMGLIDSMRYAIASAASHISHEGSTGAVRSEVDGLLSKVEVKKLF